jgi:ABC-type oligopeptide transport system substrate-binding subunit
MYDDLHGTYIQEDPSSTYNGTDTNRFSTGSEKATKENPFTSVTFRNAFAAAFDYDEYILNVTGGVYKRLEGIVPEGMLGHADDLIDNGFIPNYSPNVAETLFNQTGWRGNITLFYNTGNIGRKTTSLLLKDTIESLDVGIKINASEITWPEYLDITNSLDMPIYLNSGWGADYPDPDNLDILIDQQAGEMFEALRSATISIIEEELAQDYPWIYVSQGQRIVVVRDWIQGFPESGSLNPVFEVPRYQFLTKPSEWPKLTTITETTTETDTATITEIVTETITTTETLIQTETITSVVTTTVPGGIETVTLPVTQTETVTVTVTTSNVVSISTTNGGFEVLVILGTIGLVGVLLKRRNR